MHSKRQNTNISKSAKKLRHLLLFLKMESFFVPNIVKIHHKSNVCNFIVDYNTIELPHIQKIFLGVLKCRWILAIRPGDIL